MVDYGGVGVDGFGGVGGVCGCCGFDRVGGYFGVGGFDGAMVCLVEPMLLCICKELWRTGRSLT